PPPPPPPRRPPPFRLSGILAAVAAGLTTSRIGVVHHAPIRLRIKAKSSWSMQSEWKGERVGGGGGGGGGERLGRGVGGGG
ncbi:hypothetical protein, partial [Escherichia coli]|uniref:hypothetical protein n=1 Tax=Escherichia coli TaxID=562 RepID=UPI002119795A